MADGRQAHATAESPITHRGPGRQFPMRGRAAVAAIVTLGNRAESEWPASSISQRGTAHRAAPHEDSRILPRFPPRGSGRDRRKPIGALRRPGASKGRCRDQPYEPLAGTMPYDPFRAPHNGWRA